MSTINYIYQAMMGIFQGIWESLWSDFDQPNNDNK